MTEASAPERKIFVIDDQPVYGRGVGFILESDGYQTVELNPSNLVKNSFKITKPHPLLVVIGRCPQFSIISEIICELKLNGIPSIAIIDLSNQNEAVKYFTQIAKLGDTFSFIRREGPVDEIREAVSFTLQGKNYIPEELQPILMMAASHAISRPELTDREQEIGRLLTSGHSIKQTADLLGLSEGTTKRYPGIIYSKLGVESNENRRVVLASFINNGYLQRS